MPDTEQELAQKSSLQMQAAATACGQQVRVGASARAHRGVAAMGVQVGGGTGDGSSHHHVQRHPLGLVPALGRLSGFGSRRHGAGSSMELANGSSAWSSLLHVTAKPIRKGCMQS